MVSHGIPVHNSLIQLFEPDKELVYVDQGAITIIEKTNLFNEGINRGRKAQSVEEIEDSFVQ